MSCSSNPTLSNNTQDSMETISIYNDYDVYDPEELANQVLFDKPRGEKRWLGKERHKGKERLYKDIKDKNVMDKTIQLEANLSKNAIKKIESSTADGFQFNVAYSLEKKNRWETVDSVSLLAGAPENLNSEVVENIGFHKKVISQNERVNAMQQTITYNIYRTHPSAEVAGTQLFMSKSVSKSGCSRRNKKIDFREFENYDEECEDEDETELEKSSDELEAHSPTTSSLDLSLCFVEKRNKKSRKSKISESSAFEVIEKEKLVTKYTSLLNIQEFLKTEGYTLENADIIFKNMEVKFEKQMEQLREDETLITKRLRSNQYFVDASGWCQLDGEIKDGEFTTIFVITHLRKNQYNILINSTIPSDPSIKWREYLQKKISKELSIHKAISKITTEMLTNKRIVETMSMASKFFGRKTLPEFFKDSNEWENQLVNMNWPNQYYHCTWANSEELSTIGRRLEWNDLCKMVTKGSTMEIEYIREGICEECHQTKQELLMLKDETTSKRTDCLIVRDEFYRELRARRFPIDLQIKCADELELLSSFIPLPIVNLYIRLASESIYRDLGKIGNFEKCPKCKSVVLFDEIVEKNEKKTQNRSCPCGYSWCRHCNKVPHWPLKCGDFAEWNEKWLLRYAIERAQGTGSQTLLQIACLCGKEIYNVRMPEQFIECPGCKTNVNMETKKIFEKHYYVPFDPITRKLAKKGYYTYEDKEGKTIFLPRATISTEIESIPVIKASVIEVCVAARDVRYNVHTRNRAVNREHALIRKGILETEIVENLLGTVVYLVENVTAWMYTTSQYDRNIKNTLESMMENRKNLLSSLEKEDSDAIKECAKKLRRDIDTVVQAVEKKIGNL